MIARTLYQILELKRNQWQSKEQQEKLQLKKLKAMVKHAYHNVPFYHELYKKNNVRPEDIKTLKDIQKLPIITKADVRDNYSQILARDIDMNKCHISHTSGSTGIPLKVVEDQKAVDYSNALINYAFVEAGARLNDKIVDLTILNKPWKYKRRFFKKHHLSVFNTCKENVEHMRKINPDVIYSGPYTLSAHCTTIKEMNVTDIRPRMVIGHGGTLVPEIKKHIESALNTKIQETYGAREFMRMAFEGPECQGMHAITDATVIEFLKENEPLHSEEEGEIVVTGLYNYAMPLIRYNIGDLGIPGQEKCSCGRNYPLIKDITGRQDDFFTLPSGKAISWYRMYRGIIATPGIKEFQIIQEKKDLIIVKIIKNQDFSEQSVKEIKTAINNSCCGEKMRIKIESVNNIPKKNTNKFKTFISKIKEGQLDSLVERIS